MSKVAYAKKIRTETLVLDFGFATLFATDRGNLFSRGFIGKLNSIDHTVTGIAQN